MHVRDLFELHVCMIYITFDVNCTYVFTYDLSADVPIHTNNTTRILCIYMLIHITSYVYIDTYMRTHT